MNDDSERQFDDRELMMFSKMLYVDARINKRPATEEAVSDLLRQLHRPDSIFAVHEVMAYYRSLHQAHMEASYLKAFPEKKRPGLQSLMHLADYLGLGLRKRIKALAGDYDAEIVRLHAEGRYRAARWNKYLAWGYAGWYVLRAPVDWAASVVIKKITGR